jgi:hypothetical protein
MEAMISTDIDIDKYRYMVDDAGRHREGDAPMDTNIAAWMIAGGPRIELAAERREREQLHAYLESRRATEGGPGLVERLRHAIRPTTAAVDPACCPA